MKLKTIAGAAVCVFIFFFTVSCIRTADLYEEGDKEVVMTPIYSYPFKNEVRDAVAEIVLKVNGQVAIEDIKTEIPYLKYNKSWLCLFTQDDCKHAAYCCTWAAINGKPLSYQYFYNAVQLQNGDLPPDVYSLKKTLGSTDGAGNEVRFAFTTTISPEWQWMDEKIEVKPGYTKDYYRFFMKSGLVWDDVKEMLSYGNGIAFHNVNIPNQTDVASITEHYGTSQKIILDKLPGRGCKMLAEPDGNKAYVTAAQGYAPIQIMTAQAGTVTLYPFQVTDDLQKKLWGRVFFSIADAKKEIENQLQRPQAKRSAVHIGVHGTDAPWAQFLLFINNTYGKDGDDSVWFPCMEEYYEYNYYRTHGGTPLIERIDEQTLKLTVSLPSGEYFYYPSVTVNLKGLKKENIASISSNNAITGLSYADYKEGVMFNIDCRKFLVEHAVHFTEQYEKDKSNSSKKADAIYFVNMLKDSPRKTELLKRIK